MQLRFSLLEKGRGGVEIRCAPGGKPRRSSGDQEKQDRHGDESQRVGGLDSDEHRGHFARDCESGQQAEDDANSRKAKSLANDKSENVARLSTQGHANANFGGTLPHDSRKHAVESDTREQSR